MHEIRFGIMKRSKISKGGQISIPADVRRRWDVAEVIVRDEGDHLVIKPLPRDPIAALAGSLPRRKPGPSIEEIRRREREIEAANERREYGAVARRVSRRRAAGG